MFTSTNINELPATVSEDGAQRINIPNDVCSITLLKFPAGSKIPPHMHRNAHLHIVLKGSAVLTASDGSSITIAPMMDYACGRFEYMSMFDVPLPSDVEMLLIEPKKP